MTARMARQYLTWRRWPRCWAVFSWRSIALRYEGDMVKRMQHIGIFLHNEMGISLRGISPMCGRSSIHLQKIFFLRSIDILQEWAIISWKDISPAFLCDLHSTGGQSVATNAIPSALQA